MPIRRASSFGPPPSMRSDLLRKRHSKRKPRWLWGYLIVRVRHLQHLL